MSLAPSTRLGPYEIVAALGAGGMGDVYRARDTRLDRTVAIKVINQQLAADPQFQARFQREAHAISSLENPHICALYDVGEHDGISFLVMQYLEGETLEMRLQKGALPIAIALQYAIEIADALDGAHRHGIVHRDLKPGNIMLTASGAKLLDFGLAKTTVSPAGAELSMLPTTPPHELTAQGTILGTFRYMAPERLEGVEADRRSDIFAFGAIAYEMLTGKKAFEGRSRAAVIAAILEHQPTSITALRTEVPHLLDHIVGRCLAKKPDDRWQSARDLRDELQWIAREQSVVVQASVGRVGRHRLTRFREVAAWSVAALALIAMAVSTFMSQTRAIAPEMRFEVAAPGSDLGTFALSPDGTQLAATVLANGQRLIWLRSLRTGLWQQLRGTEGAAAPFWSPDGRNIGFFASGKLKKIDINGGVVQILADASPRGGAWSARGVIVYAPNPFGSLAMVAESGIGDPKIVTKAGPLTRHFNPSFLPDGRHFIYVVTGPPDTRGIYLASIDAPDAKRLADADAVGSYADGWVFFRLQGVIRAQRLDLERGEMIDDAVAIANVAQNTPITGMFSTSTSGLIAYRAGSIQSYQLVWTDRTGKTLGTFGPKSDVILGAPRLHPDGRRVAMTMGVDNQDIVLLDDTRITQFTFDPSDDRFPIWSPDGRSLVFDSIRSKRRNLYKSQAPGGEQLLLETPPPEDKTIHDWSPDGRHLIFQSNNPTTGMDLWIYPFETRKPYEFLRTSSNERRAAFSPDGRWVAYLSNESGRYEVYVRPFFEPGSMNTARSASNTQARISMGGGIQPRWNPNGREIHYLAPDGYMMSVPVTISGDSPVPGAPVAMFQPQISGVDNVDSGLQYDIARDGRFLINTISGDTSPISMIANWVPPARK